MRISVIIPVFNEELTISACIESLRRQTIRNLQVIVVDDGSKDRTLDILKKLRVTFYRQKHLGPGAARNLGAKHARGDILIFVDADMTFDKKFIEKLIEPIKENTLGTFSKEELVSNKGNVWADCWSLNDGCPIGRRHPRNYPDEQPVFRAIFKKEFDRVGGFDTKIGYTDDWSLFRKLGIKAVNAPGAIFYHQNPASLGEVFRQSRWIGKNEFRTGNIFRKLFNLLRFFIVSSLIKGIVGVIKFRKPKYLIFKIIYDLGAWISVFKSFLGEKRFK